MIELAQVEQRFTARFIVRFIAFHSTTHECMSFLFAVRWVGRAATMFRRERKDADCPLPPCGRTSEALEHFTVDSQ